MTVPSKIKIYGNGWNYFQIYDTVCKVSPIYYIQISLNEAMTLGVPMVAMPFINDQISNANRVVEMGIGKKVRSFPSIGRELYATCQSVISDVKIKNRCLVIQTELQKDECFDKIITKIEELLI